MNRVNRLIFICILLSLVLLDVSFGAAIPKGDVSPTSITAAPGEVFPFTVSFDNIGDAIAYGPFLDVLQTSPLVTLNTATSYIGINISPVVMAFTTLAPCYYHPYLLNSTGGEDTVCGAPGTTLYSYRLPFLSYASSQPTIDISLTASISQGSATISVRGGFTYVTPDKPVTQASLISAWKNTTISASVAKPSLTFSSSTFGTDPSTIYSCFFNLNFATGTLVVNGTAVIWLPCGVHFIGFDAASTGKNLAYAQGTFQPETGFKDQVTVDLNDNPNTTVQLNNVYVAFQFYFSYDEVVQCYGGGSGGGPIIVPWSVGVPYYVYDPTCNCVKYYNPGTSVTKAVSRFIIGRTMVDPLTPSTIKPGDTLQNRADVTFYMAESQTCIDSVIWAENGMVDVPVSGSASAKVDATTLTFTPTVDGDGDFTYNISDGLAQSPLTPPYLFEALYQTTIQANAARTHGSTVTAVTDFYFNEVDCTTGEVVQPIHLTASNALRISSGKLTMTQYAKSGTVCEPCSKSISPTTLVTVSLNYTLPISTFQNFKLDIYMPYPPLPVSTMTFDDVIDATPPALYHCKFGSGETLRSTYSIVPTVSSDATNNRVTLTYSNYFDSSSTSTTAHILCTFKTVDTDFPDELPIAAQMASSELNVGTSTTYSTYTLSRPVIGGSNIYKGFVASSNVLANLTTGSISFNAPGTSGSRWNAASIPITSTYFTNNQASLTSGVSQVDANDLLTVIVVINNQGSSPAYDVKVSDAIPTGLSQPSGGYNMRVTTGSGTVLTTSGDLFSGGLTVTNGGNPPMQSKTSTTGDNIIIITYDLKIDSISPGYPIAVDGVTLLGYAAYVAGPQYASNVASNKLTIDGAAPSIQTPVLVSSSLSETGTSRYSSSYPDFALGESFILSVTMKFPEGVTKATYFEFAFPTVATGVIHYANSSINYGDNISAATSTVTSDTSTVRITFGDVTNTADNVLSAKDEITILVAGLVVATGNAQSSTVRNSNGLLQYGIQNSLVQNLTTTFGCELVEPVLTITRTWTMTGTSNADDTITMTIVVQHNSGSTNSAAYNLNITDALGSYLVSNSDATASMGTIVQQNPLQVSIPVLAIGSSTTITYTAKLVSTLELNQQVVSTASVVYYSATDASLAKSYSGTSTTTQNSAIATLSSALISTSLAETAKDKYSTSIDDLAIGETATIHSTITLPEGKISSAVVTFKTSQVTNGVLEIVSAHIYSVGTSISGSPTPAINQAATITQGTASVPGIATWSLGNLVNTPDNVADANDQLVVEVVVKPTVGKATQSSTVRSTTVELASSLTTTSVTAIQFEVVEPVKTLSRATTMTTSSDGHDLITITLTIGSGSPNNAAAYQTVVTDDASSSMTLVVGSVTVTGTSSYTVQSGDTTGDTSLSVLVPKILSGASNIVITYQARIVDNIQAATSVVGTGSMTYYSNSDTSATNAKSYTTTASNTVVSKGPAIAIAVASTSLSETGADPGNSAIQTLAIGETIVYTITATLQEGSLSNTQITFTATQVATGTLEVLAANVSFVGSSITGNPPTVGQTATVSTGGLGTNSIARFTLGNLYNDPDNTQNTQDTIQFTVVCRPVLNFASQTGNALTNTAALSYGSSGSVSATSQVKIYDAVPLLISKTSNIATSVDGGDIIAVSLTIQPDTTSGNLGPAYLVVANDLLAPDMSVVIASATTNKTGAVITTGPTSKDLQVSIPVIQKTDPAIRISYNVAVNSQIEASSVSMQAKVQSYTSPDVTNSKTYTVQTSTVSATVPTISTAIALASTSLAESGSDSSNPLIENLFLGEVAVLRLTIQFPEGNTSNAFVNITVPQSAKNVMEIVSSKVLSIGANLYSNVAIAVNQAGVDTVGALGVVSYTQFDFGNIYNAPDNAVSSADKITIELSVRFASGQGNDPTGTAVSVSLFTASLRATNPNSYQFKLVDTTQLSLIKAIPLSNIVDAGDIITANITVAPSSSTATAAYNIMVIDELGPYVTVLTNTITKSNANAVVTVSGTSVVIQLGVLSGTNTLIVTYQVQAIAQLEVLTTIDSKANMTYYSNSDIQSAKVYQVTSPNFSSTTSQGTVSSSVTATSFTETTKSQYDTNVDDLILGETATVTYVITFAEGRTTGSSLSVVSSEATGRVVEIISMSVLSVGSKLSSSINLLTTTATLSEGTVTGVNTRASMNLGNVLNTADNINNANDQMRVTVVLRFWNTASATQTGADALTTITFNSNAYTDSTTTALELLLTKPVTFTKTATGVQDGIDEGDKINVTIVISRDSTSTHLGPAYMISITDDLSSQLVVVPGTFRTSNANVIKTESSTTTNTVSFDLAVLLITDNDVTITYLVTPIVGIRPNTGVSSMASFYYQASTVNDGSSPSWSSQSSAYEFTSALISASTSTDALAPGVATYRDPEYVTLSVGQTGVIKATFGMPEGNTTNIVITVNTPTDPDTLMAITSVKVYSSGSKLSSDVSIINVVPVVTNPSTTYDSRAVFTFSYIYNLADNIKNANDQLVLELQVIFPLELSVIQPCATTFSLTSDTYNVSTQASFLPAPTSDLLLVRSSSMTDNMDAGDLISANVTVFTASDDGSDTYHINVRDVLSGLVYEALSAKFSEAKAFLIPDPVDFVSELPFREFNNPDDYVIQYSLRIDSEAEANSEVSAFAELHYQSADDATAKNVSLSTRTFKATTASPSYNFQVSTMLPETTEIAGVHQVTFGETATATFTITFTEGRTSSSQISVFASQVTSAVVEILSVTVTHVGSKISSSVDLSTVEATLIPNVNGVKTNATLNLGNILNTYDNVVDDKDRVTVEVVFRSVPDASETFGVTATNLIQFDSQTIHHEEQFSMVLVDSHLNITEETSAHHVAAGDIIYFTITVSPMVGSNGPLYDIEISESLPDQLNLASASDSVITNQGNVVSSLNTDKFTVSVPIWTPADGDIVVYAACTVSKPSVTGSDFSSNGATLSYRTAPSAKTASYIERSDQADPINFFTAPSTFTLKEADPSSRQANSVFLLEIGQVFLMQAEIVFARGVSSNTTLTLSLPNGLVGALQPIEAMINFTGVAVEQIDFNYVLSDSNNDGINDLFTVSLGDVLIVGNNETQPTESLVVITFATIADHVSRDTGDVLTATLGITFSGSNSSTDSLSIQIVEPVSTSSTKINQIDQLFEIDDTFTTVVTLQHDLTSHSPLYEIVIQLAGNTSSYQILDSSVVTSIASIVTVDSINQTIHIAKYDLESKEDLVVTFDCVFVEATVGSPMQTGVIVTGKSSAPHSDYPAFNEAITYNIEESYRSLGIKNPDITIFVVDPATGERLDTLELPVSGEGYIKALIYVPKSLVPSLSVHFELNEQLALKDGELITIKCNTTLYIGDTTAMPLEQIEAGLNVENGGTTFSIVFNGSIDVPEHQVYIEVTFPVVRINTNSSGNSSTSAWVEYPGTNNTTSNGTRTIIPDSVIKSIEPELNVIVTKVDPVVIEKSGDNATINLLILHTTRSTYTAFLVNFKLTLPDIYEFVPDTIIARVDNETLDVYVNGSDLIVFRDHLNLNERIAIEFVAIGYNPEFSSTSSLSNIYCSYTTTSDTTTQFSVYNQLSVYRKIQITPDVAVLGPLSYFPTDDIALSPIDQVGASYNLPLLSTSNDNSSFIALSFDLSHIKSYFAHIHQLALVLPIASTEGQFSDSQLHIHVSSIGSYVWDENTADYASMISVSPHDTNDTLQVGEISLPKMLKYVQIDLDRALIVLNENQTKVNLVIHATEGSEAAKLTIFSKESSANEAARLIIEFERPPAQSTCQQSPARNSEFGAVTWLTGDLCLPACHLATSAGLICDPTVSLTPATDHKDLMPLFSSESSVQGGALRFVLKLPLSALPLDDSVTFQFKLGNEQRASAVYAYPGVLWTTRVVNATESDLGEAQWILEMPWKLALTAGWSELTDKKNNRHVWSTNLTILIDDEHVWRYPVEVQVPEVPQLGMVFSTNTTAGSTRSNSTGITLDTPYIDFEQLKLVVPIISTNTNSSLLEILNSTISDEWSLVDDTDYSTCVNTTKCTQTFNLVIPLEQELPSTNHTIVSIHFEASTCPSCPKQFVSLTIDFNFGASNIRSMVTLHWDYEGTGEVLNNQLVPTSVFTVFDKIFIHAHVEQLPLNRSVFVQGVLDQTSYDSLALVIDSTEYVLIENGQVTTTGQELQLQVVSQSETDVTVSLSFANSQLIVNNETQATIISVVLTEQLHQLNFTQHTLWPVYTAHNVTVIIPPTFDDGVVAPAGAGLDVILPAVIVPGVILLLVLGFLLWFILIAAGQCNHYCLQY